MFGGLLANTLDQLTVAEAFVEAHDEFVRQQPLAKQGAFRVDAVSACVTRVYAIYEHFVESILSDFLDAIPELTPYASLSSTVKAEYRVGISYILSRIDGERYSHLSHENVVRWYHEALTSAGPYQFVTEAFTRHDHNLRLDVVEGLLTRVDLKQFDQWLTRCGEVRDLYEEHAALREQLGAELRSFVQIRNDAAHGILEELQGKEVLLRYCSLIRAIVRSIAGYFHSNLLARRTQAGRAIQIGTVTEVLKKPGAFIATLVNGKEIQRGGLLHFVATGYCTQQAVSSLQLNDVAVEHVLATTEAFEVGVKCAELPKNGVAIFVELPAALPLAATHSAAQ